MDNGRVSTDTRSTRVNRSGKIKRWALALAAVGFLGLGFSSAHADSFFDWNAEGTNGNVPPAPYIPTPTLSDATASQVAAFLASQPAGQLAVKVRAGVTLSPATITAIYGRFNVNYTFIDYEGSQPTVDSQVTTLVNQIKGSSVTGPQVIANNSYVSNFQIAPISTDNTHPSSVTYTSGNSAAESYFTITDFRNTGVNMSSESLYPGDASFRNPIYGTNTAGSGSNAPNIRSALFTLPIVRMTLASQNLGAGQLHIPYIARFNNSDNPTFSNATESGIKVFDTTIPNSTLGGQPVAGQLLSRDDFEAMVLHYRMRGANGYHLLDPGVVGYTEGQEQLDAQNGWNGNTTSGSLVNSVFQGANARSATLPTLITVDGQLKTIENAGVVWSGVTNDNTTGTELAILVSNLDAGNHVVGFNTTINGAKLVTSTGTLGGGTHTLLRFTKIGGSWSLTNTDPIFNDTNLASRDGVGIPEPASLALLGVGAMGVLVRRRRKA